jgi:hypothetical protein
VLVIRSHGAHLRQAIKLDVRHRRVSRQVVWGLVEIHVRCAVAGGRGSRAMPHKNDARGKPAHHRIDECDPDYSVP